jgi:hypothetical protein
VTNLTPREKFNEVSRFVRSKASPLLGQTLNLATGEDLGRNPINLSTPEGVTNLAAGLVVPLSVRDIADVMEDQGATKGTALSILGLLGEGLQVFSD